MNTTKQPFPAYSANTSAYDPGLGKVTSFGQGACGAKCELQASSYDRFTYCQNNPMKYEKSNNSK
jgi:hypothetical protein